MANYSSSEKGSRILNRQTDINVIQKENCMARVKILFATMFLISLFLMCGGCESHRHERREDLRDKQSEREELRDKQSEREQQLEQERQSEEQDSDSRGGRHEERH